MTTYDATVSKIVQARDVSDTTFETLSRQAKKRGQSLSQYLRDELDELARQSNSVEHNLRIIREAQAEPGPKVSTEDILAALHEGRNER